MAEPRQQPRPPVAWARLALLASIGLNLLFAGLWLGWTIRPAFRGPPPGGPIHALAQRLEGRLAPASMARVNALVADADATFADGARRTAAARVEIVAALAAEPFDRDAFVAAVDGLITGRARSDADLARKIAAAMAELSPAERRAVAETVVSMPGPPAPHPPR